jgi:tetratricopeptide (TPR) repeat protein
MPETPSKDLRYAENLRREGKFQEALNVINNIEKKRTFTPKDQLSLLILKGKIYTLFQNYTESIKVGETTYKLSQGLEQIPDIIMSLLFKANCVFLGQADQAMEHLLEAEELLNTLSDVSPTFISRQKGNILFRKSWAFFYQNDYKNALETAKNCLEIYEKFNKKTEIAYTLQIIGFIYETQVQYEIALEYALKSLKLFEEVGDPIGTATTLLLIGRIYYLTGEVNKALTFCKKSLSTGLISELDKTSAYTYIGLIYNTKGELERALRYFKRGFSLAEKNNFYGAFVNLQILIGAIYIQKREYKLALEYLKPGLTLSKNTNNILGIGLSLAYQGLIYYEQDSKSELQEIIDQLKEFSEKYNDRFLIAEYNMAKAMMLQRSNRSRDRAEAEKLLKQTVKNPASPDLYVFSLANLCEFYLEELKLFNESDILEEIHPLITQLLAFSKEQKSYGTLATAKLAEAKVKLIQMDFNGTKKLLTEAQKIADLHGYTLMAQKISSEHDNLLDQIKSWEEFKERNAPIEERLELASIEGVIERLQGKRTIDPPEIIEETPILLLIMDESGNTFFNHSFIENWDFHDLFSAFMSAFNTFSGEIFSKSIDRIKIGENTILINPIESFLACYVIKGQSYPAQQKLNRFTDALKNNAEIWDTLNKAVRTSEMLELNKPASLGVVINDIFA